MKQNTAILLLIAAWTAAVQAPGRGAPIKSPEVSADGKVTFRLRAPNAKEVFVTGLSPQRLAMEKNDQGVWTAAPDKAWCMFRAR